jgi:hypothetical protein
LQATKKHYCFKDTALAAQELVAAEEKNETTAMMFTLLQEQHKAQLKLMAASNKQAMDTMFEHMNALIVGHGKAVDKVTALPANKNTRRASRPPAAQSATERNVQTAENMFIIRQKMLRA